MPEMTVVLDVKTVRVCVGDPVWHVARFPRSALWVVSGDADVTLPQEIRESIFGRNYVTAGGKVVCIGMALAVQEALGLQCEAFETMRNESQIDGVIIAGLKAKYIESCNRIARFNEMPWWKRVWRIVKGNLV